MTTTPRTDANLHGWEMKNGEQLISADFARQLERELAAKERELNDIFRSINLLAVHCHNLCVEMPVNSALATLQLASIKQCFDQQQRNLTALQVVAREQHETIQRLHDCWNTDRCEACKDLTENADNHYNSLPPEVRGEKGQ